jgi:hypothetical protein
MRRFKDECELFRFNKCPTYTHDGASAKYSTNSHETDNSVVSLMDLWAQPRLPHEISTRTSKLSTVTAEPTMIELFVTTTQTSSIIRLLRSLLRAVTHIHRVGRVLSLSPVVGVGTPPTPHPQASASPPLVPGRGAHSLAREGVGESQFRRGDIHCGGTLYILCAHIPPMLRNMTAECSNAQCTPLPPSLISGDWISVISIESLLAPSATRK